MLSLRLETVTITGGDVAQLAAIDQVNVINQIGGNCKRSSCDQFNLGRDAAAIFQNATQRTTLDYILEDNRELFQVFGDHGGDHGGKY